MISGVLLILENINELRFPLWELMNLLAGELPFELDAAPVLPALEDAVENLTAFLSR